MEESTNSIVESRKELMISPSDPQNPILRTAHFLKPCVSSDPKAISELPSLSVPSLPASFNPRDWPLKVEFTGWKNSPEGWKEWVHKMASLHSLTWKKAGIYDAILNSTHQLNVHRDLIFGVAEKWCPDTSSFVFPWGEATITLEDMLISGYSALGFPVYEPIETEELKETQQKLVKARMEFVRSRAQKAEHNPWLKKFMNTGSEIEHEAFLSLWLSRFVLPTSQSSIAECIFPIAIHLARGTRIALAPTVLASIYRDLTLLKQNIVALTTLDADSDAKLSVTVWSPFQLVLVWLWERFVKLSPKPNVIKNGEPRFARWNNLRFTSKTVRLLLDSSKGSFNWRPYTKQLENWDMPQVYNEKEMWVSVNSDLDEDLLAFIRCLRASDLVGLNCIVQYLPQRVARQFGFDQDIPGCVAGPKTDPDDAWSGYIRPLGDARCYVPSCLFDACVTKRYIDWWESLGFDDQVVSSEPDQGLRKKAGQKFSDLHQMIVNNLKRKRAEDVIKKVRVSDAGSKRKRKAETYSSKRSGVSGAPADFTMHPETTVNCFKVKTEEMAEVNNLPVPPGFAKTHDRVEARDSSEEEDICKFPKILKVTKKHDVSGSRQSFKGNDASGKAYHSSAIGDNMATGTTTEIQNSEEIKDVRKCWSNGKDKENDFVVGLGELRSRTSSVAGNEIVKDADIEEGKQAENVAEKEDVESANTSGPAESYESINESAKEALLSLENTVQRVEKLFAAFSSKTS